MSSNQDEIIDESVENKAKPTKWGYWYIGLILFLVVQILIYLFITNSYK